MGLDLAGVESDLLSRAARRGTGGSGLFQVGGDGVRSTKVLKLGATCSIPLNEEATDMKGVRVFVGLEFSWVRRVYASRMKRQRHDGR